MDADFCEALAGLKNLTVMYAEDDPVIRTQVTYFLQKRVGRLLEAGNGLEAWEIFQRETPDLVLTDIQMPVMSGLALAERIKAVSRETPVIITTAHNEPGFLQQAIDCGVDGYVMKPVNLEQMMTVMLRSVRQLLGHRELQSSRAVLLEYHRRAESERSLVAELMSRLMRPERLADPRVGYWTRPAEMVGGDLIGVARSPYGRLYFMLADSTGHGLASTINLLPINHIFYRMVSRNQPVSLMVEEMNWALREQSPTGMYVAAAVGCLDEDNCLLEVWNGGVPDAVLFSPEGEELYRFPSDNLPLGVLDETFDPKTKVYQWTRPGQLLLYSDGFSDAENAAGMPFDSTGVEAAARAALPAARLQAVTAAVADYVAGETIDDDMTILLVDSGLPQGPADRGD